jgi:rhodanese-related sulfurtransferase
MRALLNVQWTMKRTLAASALLLGVLAMAGEPVQGHVVRLDTRELAALVELDTDHVQPEELGDWIVRGASDYRLIDVRDAKAFAEYHIPSAERVPIAQLADADLARNETIVLYSEDGVHAAQAWMLLRARGFKGVRTLDGGLDGWKEDVVFPIAPANPTPWQTARFERRLQVAKFFGGHGRAADAEGSAGALTIAAPEVPKAAAPAAAAPGGGAVSKKKKKEGC